MPTFRRMSATLLPTLSDIRLLFTPDHGPATLEHLLVTPIHEPTILLSTKLHVNLQVTTNYPTISPRIIPMDSTSPSSIAFDMHDSDFPTSCFEPYTKILEDTFTPLPPPTMFDPGHQHQLGYPMTRADMIRTKKIANRATGLMIAREEAARWGFGSHMPQISCIMNREQ